MLECRSCPYGEEDFKRRMYWYEKTIKEQGIPNDIYHYLKPEDASDEFEQFLWCDKVDGKVYWAGRCTDAYSDIPKRINYQKQKRRNKRERDQKYRNKLKRLSTCTSSPHTFIQYTDIIYIRGQGDFENPKPYYKKLYYGENSKKRYKRIASKHVRRYKGEIHNGNMYRKIFDYKWEVD